MAYDNIIEFYPTLEQAIDPNPSTMVDFLKVDGIQLLPSNEYKYIQKTSVYGGIDLEDWTVFLSDCDNPENDIDITPYFDVEEVFSDDNGYDQFYWSLDNVPHDLGNKMVHLRVEQTIGETFYSNLFQITNNNKDKTCRLDYRVGERDLMQSVRVKMFFNQNQKKTEINSYYEVSTRNTVTTLVKSQKYQEWATDFIPNDLMIKIDDVFENKFVYIDLKRVNLFDAIEIQQLKNRANFINNTINLSFIDNDFYDPNEIVLNNDPTNLIDFVVIYFGSDTFPETCTLFDTPNIPVKTIYQHNGISSLPFVGDFIFRSQSPELGDFPLEQLNGENKYFGIEDNKWIRISPIGEVIEKGDC